MITNSVNYYNGIAKGYNQLYACEQLQKLQCAYENIPSAWDLQKVQRVLDVGCGTGISTDFWSEKMKLHAIGIDPAEELLKQNLQNVSKFEVGFAEKLIFKNSCFDLVISFSAIQNFSDVLQGLSEIKRVGKKYFILTVMDRGEHFSEIQQKISELFTIITQVTCLNDTIFYCES